MPDTLRRRDLSLLALCCVVLRLPALMSSRWFDPDEAAIAVQARTIVSGGRLYVDMADRKPPLPPMLYAIWFDLTGSSDPRGPRLFVAVALAVAAVVLAAEVCRTHGRQAGLWAGALFVVGCYGFVPPDAAAANYAHFAVPLATLAILACRRTGWYPLAGGALLGFALLSRQSWVFAVPAGALSCWMTTRVRGVALYALGLVAAVATAGLMAPWTDYWFWNFKSSPGFVFAAIEPGPAIAAGAASLALFGVLHLAVVVGAGSRVRATWRSHADLWLWVLSGTAAWAAGFRFFGHYWLQVVPPLVLLAAPAVAAWRLPWRRLAAASLGATAVFAVGAQFAPDAFHPRPDAGPVARAIQACTDPDQRVFVWGSYPELMVAVDRPIAGGLVHSDFITGRSGGRSDASGAETPGARERMIADLFSQPPAVLVDTSSVDDLGYEAFPMLDDPDLADLVDRGDYQRSTTGSFTLWFAPGSTCAADAAS